MTAQLNVLREWTPISCTKEMLKESKEKYGKVILSGIIQRANTLNQNGRVYPRPILEREIMNYQKMFLTLSAKLTFKTMMCMVKLKYLTHRQEK